MIPFKSVLSGIKSIETRNQKFKTLSVESKRQEIAYDALKLVLAGKLMASDGCFWDDELYDLKQILEKNGKSAKDFQMALNKELPTCKVCQRGLMMVSVIRLGNQISPDDGDAYCGSEETLRGKGFTKGQFLRMEGEFEESRFEHPYEDNTDEKLANICCNVIANGTFNTDDKRDYLKKWKLKIKK
jgi:hypothetical protein